VVKGHISRAQVFTDSLQPAPLNELAVELVDTPYRPAEVEQVCQNIIQRHPALKTELSQLQQWLVSCIQ
jgi:lipoate-protein ligase A